MASAFGIASPTATALPAAATGGFPEAYAEIGGTLILVGGRSRIDSPAIDGTSPSSLLTDDPSLRTSEAMPIDWEKSATYYADVESLSGVVALAQDHNRGRSRRSRVDTSNYSCNKIP